MKKFLHIVIACSFAFSLPVNAFFPQVTPTRIAGGLLTSGVALKLWNMYTSRREQARLTALQNRYTTIAQVLDQVAPEASNTERAQALIAAYNLNQSTPKNDARTLLEAVTADMSFVTERISVNNPDTTYTTLHALMNARVPTIKDILIEYYLDSRLPLYKHAVEVIESPIYGNPDETIAQISFRLSKSPMPLQNLPYVIAAEQMFIFTYTNQTSNPLLQSKMAELTVAIGKIERYLKEDSFAMHTLKIQSEAVLIVSASILGFASLAAIMIALLNRPNHNRYH